MSLRYSADFRRSRLVFLRFNSRGICFISIAGDGVPLAVGYTLMSSLELSTNNYKGEQQCQCWLLLQLGLFKLCFKHVFAVFKNLFLGVGKNFRLLMQSCRFYSNFQRLHADNWKIFLELSACIFQKSIWIIELIYEISGTFSYKICNYGIVSPDSPKGFSCHLMVPIWFL